MSNPTLRWGSQNASATLERKSGIGHRQALYGADSSLTNLIQGVNQFVEPYQLTAGNQGFGFSDTYQIPVGMLDLRAAPAVITSGR